MQTLTGKLRPTVLEGSYGNDKKRYNLQEIKSRNEKMKVIFFGMMTANGIKVA